MIKVTKLSEQEIDARGIYTWPIWTCEASEFDWEYDTVETCLLLEGRVEVITDGGIVTFGVGDFVEFPKGLKCRWIVREPVRKYYNFEEE